MTYFVIVTQAGAPPDADPQEGETLADARDILSGEIALTLDTMGYRDDEPGAYEAAQGAARDAMPGAAVVFAGYTHVIVEAAA